MSDLTFGQYDTQPSIFGTLTNISEADLSAATVRFQMRLVTDRRYWIDAAAVVVDAALKQVRYDFVPGDLSVPGDYMSWWLVTFLDATTEHSLPANTITVSPT